MLYKYLLLFSCCLVWSGVLGQYQLESVYTRAGKESFIDEQAEPAITRFHNGMAWSLNYTAHEQGIQVTVNRYDLRRNQLLPAFRFKNKYTDYIQDFYAQARDVYFIAGDQLFYRSFKPASDAQDAQYSVPLGVNYDKVYPMGTERLLLSHVYNHHPADGKPGIYLAVFHTATKSFQDSLYIPFECIGMSHLVSQWIAVQGEDILIIDPLQGTLSTYDKRLRKKSSQQLQIFDAAGLQQNRRFRSFLDSGIVQKHAGYAQARKKYPADSLAKRPELWDNTPGAKGYIKWLGDTLRKNYSYIEKLWLLDSGKFAVTVVEPGKYEEEQVLMVFTTGNPVPEKRIHWRVSSKETLEKPEDYFVIDLRNTIYEPFFYSGKVYAWQENPVNLFETGRKLDLDRKMLKHASRRKLQLVSYSYQ